MRAYIEKDPAEADSPCLVAEIGRLEFFVWFEGLRPRFTAYRNPS